MCTDGLICHEDPSFLAWGMSHLSISRNMFLPRQESLNFLSLTGKRKTFGKICGRFLNHSEHLECSKNISYLANRGAASSSSSSSSSSPSSASSSSSSSNLSVEKIPDGFDNLAAPEQYMNKASDSTDGNDDPNSPWSRADAFLYLQKFHTFAVESCGCLAPGNRAHVKRSILYATQDLNFQTLVRELGHHEISALESLAAMECPVLIPDKTMEKVNESMSMRIQYASKRLRRHFSLSETITCRGCTKRKRCGKFKEAAPQEPISCDLADASKVLFGLSQYCRVFLQDCGHNYPALPRATLKAAIIVLDGISRVLAAERETYARTQGVSGSGHARDCDTHVSSFTKSVPSMETAEKSPLRDKNGDMNPFGRGTRLWKDIPQADAKTAREISNEIASRQGLFRMEQKEKALLKLPPWMQDTMKPVISKHMNARQRYILQQRERAKAATQEENCISQESIDDGLDGRQNDDIKSLYDLQSMPIVKRFERINKGTKLDTIVQFNSMYEKYVEGVTRKRERANVRVQEEAVIDLDLYHSSLHDNDSKTQYKLRQMRKNEIEQKRQELRELLGPQHEEEADRPESDHEETKTEDIFGNSEECSATSESTCTDSHAVNMQQQKNLAAQESTEKSDLDELFATFDIEPQQADIKVTENSTIEAMPKPYGGYSSVDLGSGETFAALPEKAREAVYVAPQALHGTHVYKNMPSLSKEEAHLLKASVSETEVVRDGDRGLVKFGRKRDTRKRTSSVVSQENEKSDDMKHVMHPVFGSKVVKDLWSNSSDLAGMNFLMKMPFDDPVSSRSGGTSSEKTGNATLALAVQKNRLDRALSEGFLLSSEHPKIPMEKQKKKRGECDDLETDYSDVTEGTDPLSASQCVRRTRSCLKESSASDNSTYESVDTNCSVQSGSDFEYSEDDSTNSGQQLERRFYSCNMNSEGENNYDDLTEPNSDCRKESKRYSWPNKRVQIDSASSSGISETAQFRFGTNSLRRDWMDEDEMKTPSSTTESLKTASNNSVTKRRLVFPDLPDVEQTFLQQTGLSKNMAMVKKSPQGLRQVRLHDDLKALYKKSEKDATPSGKTQDQTAAVALQRILNKHIKEKNKREKRKGTQY